jgi:7,8-dihydropterin-6-yl-methyl-4-(beta-D-ribofuranosyl)aminobenzene 5'-phosphate synthase
MLKITTLSENTADNLGLLAEWGLSILIESAGAKILFDAGQTTSAVYNAEVLGIDLKKVDKIVLSHGHADHTGGLVSVLERMGKSIEIFAHPDVVDDKYAGKPENNGKNIGMPFQLHELEKLGAKFKLSRKPVKLSAEIMTTGEVPIVTDYEAMPVDRFFVKEDASWHADELNDDQAIIINTKPGLIVVLGCSHHGMINTLYHAQKLTGRKDIRMVIGGCHLINSPVERVYKTINALKEMKIQRIGVSHCTGLEGSAIMAHELGARFFYNNACTKIEVTDSEIKVD